mgnify:CR=1 FL=1
MFFYQYRIDPEEPIIFNIEDLDIKNGTISIRFSAEIKIIICESEDKDKEFANFFVFTDGGINLYINEEIFKIRLYNNNQKDLCNSNYYFPITKKEIELKNKEFFIKNYSYKSYNFCQDLPGMET